MECGEPDCHATLQELDVFLDDEMPPDARDQIRRHLDSCPDCLNAFNFHSELKVVVREKCNNDEMPPGLLARIEECFQVDFDGDDVIGTPDH